MIDYTQKNKFTDMATIIVYEIKSNSYTIMIYIR